MRIRHVLPQPAMGMLPLDPLNGAITGAVNVAWNLALQQANAGHLVEVVGPGAQPHHDVVAGVHVHRLPLWHRLRSARYDLSYLLPLGLFTMRSSRVDVTHVHSNPFYVLPWPRSGVRVLHYQNSPVQPSPQYRRAVSRADTIVCCSRFIRQQVLDAVPDFRSPVHVLYNGTDVGRFGQIDRQSARAAYGIRDDEVVVLYVGRVSPEKGLLVLVEALGRIVGSGCANVLLLVAGSWRLGHEGNPSAWKDLHEYGEQVRRQSAGLPARFLGDVGQRDLVRLYRAADIFVCPSVYDEPFGMVNVEAAAAGLPVVASAVGGIPEAVAHGRTGLLVPAGDCEALAGALGTLVADPELRRRLGSAGRAFAARFDWPVLSDEVMRIYDVAMRRSPSSRFGSKRERWADAVAPGKEGQPER